MIIYINAKNEKKNYCNYCFSEDEHIKRDINNLKILSQKCSIHKKALTHYCNDCKTNICISCIKNKESIHKHHEILCLIDLIPSSDEIICLLNEINKRSLFYDNVLNSIEKWETELKREIYELKENLKNEISILK